MAVDASSSAHWAKEPIRYPKCSLRQRTLQHECAIEALAPRVAFYLNACQNIKSLSLGNAATSRSTIRNIHGITLGSLTVGTKCRLGRSRLSGQSETCRSGGSVCGFALGCHMLTFLAIACKKKFVLDEYVDEAVGQMEKNAKGRLAITRVTLAPKLKFSGEKQPTQQELEEMNHSRTRECFIANSVKTEGQGRTADSYTDSVADVPFVVIHRSAKDSASAATASLVTICVICGNNDTPSDTQRMEKIVSLCKRRGFIFQSSEIYGGLNGAWDYGPLGVELKRNLKNYWWRVMVHERDDVVGMDGSILMNRAVWKASGHEDTFSDPMVDCLLTGTRFRADQIEPQSGTFTIIWCLQRNR